MDRSVVDSTPCHIRARIFLHSKHFLCVYHYHCLFLYICSRLFLFFSLCFPVIFTCTTLPILIPFLFDIIAILQLAFNPSHHCFPILLLSASSLRLFLTPSKFSGGSSLGVPVVSSISHNSITAFDVYYCLIVFKCYSYQFLVTPRHIGDQNYNA